MFGMARMANLAELRQQALAIGEGHGARPLYVTQDRIARIDVSGPMTKYETSFQALFGGTSTLRTRQAVRAAVRDPEVLGIMVVFDSPGGSVAGTSDLADEIRAADLRKPTDAYAWDLMASAALFAACPARHIWANKSALLGSIGAFSVVIDTSGVYAQEGAKVHVISSAPPIKGAGTPGSEVTAPQLAEWERQIRELAGVFVGELASGRRRSREWAESVATGHMWVADRALDLGLIDGVWSLDEAMDRLRSEAMEEKDTKAALALAEEAEAKATAEKSAREAVEKQLAEIKGKLTALETEKRQSRFSAEAKAIGAPTAFADVLDKIEAAAGAEPYAALLTQLKAYAAQVKEGALFSEIGTSGASASAATAYEEARALAQAKVKAGTAKSFKDALSLVWKEQPQLWERHEKERGKVA